MTGLKTWELRHDFKGKSKISKIEHYPQINMHDARDLAVKLKEEVEITDFAVTRTHTALGGTKAALDSFEGSSKQQAIAENKKGAEILYLKVHFYWSSKNNQITIISMFAGTSR